MRYDSRIHHRRSIRLREYNYSRPGTYYVTICIQDRLCLLGNVVDEKVELNEAGKMVERIWYELPQFYSGVDIDSVIIMPNHLHGNIVLTGHNVIGTLRLSLPDVVHRFKSLTTSNYIKGVDSAGWKPFRIRLWQRNYYEHVVRNDEELNRIRQYMEENPMKWDEDEYNPNR